MGYRFASLHKPIFICNKETHTSHGVTYDILKLVALFYFYPINPILCCSIFYTLLGIFEKNGLAEKYIIAILLITLTLLQICIHNMFGYAKN